MIRNLLIAILLSLPLLGGAQKRLVSLANDLPTQKNVEELIFSERRDPKTRRVIESARIFRITNTAVVKRLIQTFKQEREHATAYQANLTSAEGSTYCIEFIDTDKNELSRYTLIQDQPSVWTFHIQTVSCPIPPRKHSENIEPTSPDPVALPLPTDLFNEFRRVEIALMESGW